MYFDSKINKFEFKFYDHLVSFWKGICKVIVKGKNSDKGKVDVVRGRERYLGLEDFYYYYYYYYCDQNIINLVDN